MGGALSGVKCCCFIQKPLSHNFELANLKKKKKEGLGF